MIGSGHQLSEINRYTLRQALAFTELGRDRRKTEMLHSIIAARSANVSDLKKYLYDLELTNV